MTELAWVLALLGTQRGKESVIGATLGSALSTQEITTG